jgi:hypothetical protein
MQILILGSSLETAIALDATMLDQQIEVCDQIISKIKAGEVDESIEAYKDHLWWLQMHCNTLDYYRRDNWDEAEEMSYLAQRYKPSFVTEELISENRKKFCNLFEKSLHKSK